jgi:RES domain-containing protein
MSELPPSIRHWAQRSNVVDLTDPVVLGAHAVDPHDLACPWEDLSTRGQIPPSWALARRLSGEGVAAIVVPSFDASGATQSDRRRRREASGDRASRRRSGEW